MSTPGRYVDALKKEKVKWPVKYGDFMNYFEEDRWDKSNPFAFWSGYFTSRSDYKK